MSDDPSRSMPAHGSFAPPTPAGADASSPSVAPHEPLAPAYGRAWRAMFAVVAAMCLVAAAIGALGGSWIVAASMVVFGGFVGYFAVTGKRPADPSRAPASARFHELADPTRPLTRDDLGLTSGTGGPPASPERPAEEG